MVGLAANEPATLAMPTLYSPAGLRAKVRMSPLGQGRQS